MHAQSVDFHIYIHEKELQNVNKGRQRTSRNLEMWAINVFDKWWEFCGFNTKNPLKI